MLFVNFLNMKKIITALICVLGLGLLPFKAEAQNVTREGNTFVSTKKTSTKKEPIKTIYTYIDSDGKTYVIYLSPTGKAYIIKTSKKTGKQYRKYLPEVTKQLNEQSKQIKTK